MPRSTVIDIKSELMKRIVADMARIYLVERAYIMPQVRKKFILTDLVKET